MSLVHNSVPRYHAQYPICVENRGPHLYQHSHLFMLDTYVQRMLGKENINVNGNLVNK